MGADRWLRQASGLFVPRQFAGKWRFQPCALCCSSSGEGCTYCSGSPPDAFRVVIANIAESTCGNCALLNATYILTYPAGSYYHYPSATCFWYYDLPTPVCNVEEIWLFFSDNRWPAELNAIEVLLRNHNVSVLTYLNFLKSHISKPACDGFNNTAIPLKSTVAGTGCDLSSATCVVTAL